MRPEALREVVEQAVREAVERVSVLEALGGERDPAVLVNLLVDLLLVDLIGRTSEA